MNQTKLNEILERARALARLRDRAGTPEEANAAAHALAGLIAKYRLDAAAVEAQTGYVEEVPGLDETPLYEYKRREPWRDALCAVICTHHGVVRYTRKSIDGATARAYNSGAEWLHPQFVTQVLLAGRPSDLVIVKAMFAWLSVEAQRLCMARGNIERRSWLVGFVVGIKDQLKAARASAAAGAAAAAIVKLDARLAETKAWMTQAYAPKGARRQASRMSVDVESARAGRARGRAQHLGRLVEDGAAAVTAPRALGDGGRKL